MASTQESRRFLLAAERFKAFFDELDAMFLERQDTLAQIALALLGREHVLMTGPPGTAKSQIASAVLGRILDETTGSPSVFARQFTESTVQTDLVGPLDFKTLMSTGRTEHFTDEGMLGAVHAFLDEVLDGRDMLLRSTLNVLHERELKQGTRTTRGQLECALMTSNRYLSEVLEGSRETLLAFVDRVAFVNFVPRGFGDPKCLSEVLRRQVAGKKPPPLRATLSIQDLDVLQAAADGVFVPEAVCDSLCALLGMLERELAAAYKADPNFLPTRYLSTRTAVRTGKILRSIAVYDHIFADPSRPLQARHGDLAMLRLTLLLAGPPKSSVDHLVLHETDPRERRQLSILRTEREIFEHCLAQLPEPPAQPGSSTSVVVLEQQVHKAMAADNQAALLDVLGRLVKMADGADDSPEVTALRDRAVGALLKRGLAGGLAQPIEAGSSNQALVQQLSALADGLESAARGAKPVARWLRGRVVQMLDETVGLTPVAYGSSFDVLVGKQTSAAQLIELASSRLLTLEALADQRTNLVARGAEVDDEPARQARWRAATAAVEEDLALLWDSALRLQVAEVLRTSDGSKQKAIFHLLATSGRQLDEHAERLVRLGASGLALKARVIGPRLAPLVRTSFERLPQADHAQIPARVDQTLKALEDARLSEALSPRDLLHWSIQALLAAVQPLEVDSARNLTAYRSMRSREQRTPMLYAAVALALRLSPPLPGATPTPLGVATPTLELVQSLPAEILQAMADADLARIERSVRFLEEWWQALSRDPSPDRSQHNRQLKLLADSRFFIITQDEGALSRFALEARLLGEAFPLAQAQAQELQERLVRLDRESLAAGRALAHGHSDLAWNEVLTAPMKPS